MGYVETTAITQPSNCFGYLSSFLNNKYFYLYKDKDAAFESIEVPTHSLFTTSDAAYLKPSVTLNASTRKQFQLDLNEEQTITLNIAYYPGWTVAANRESLAVQPNQHGLVSFTAPSGSTDYQVMLHGTAVRFWSKTLTLFAVCLTLLWMFLTLRAYRKPNRL